MSEKKTNKVDPAIKKAIMGYCTDEFAMPTSRMIYDHVRRAFSTDQNVLMAAVTAAIEKPILCTPEESLPPLKSYGELMFSCDSDFDSVFKLNRKSVRKLLTELRRIPAFRNVEESVLMKNLCCLLFFLGNKDLSLENICTVFGLGSQEILFQELIKTSKALIDMGNQVNLRWPLEREALETCERFIRKFKFPEVMGVLGDCIFGDSQSGVLFQAVVDDRSLYMDINATELTNGKPSPVNYFQSSPVFTFIKDFVPPDCNVLAASIYPDKTPNLLTPFIDNGKLTSEEKSFNSMISNCLDLFGKTLESQILRFPRLENIGFPASDAKHIVLASCVIHNASIIYHDLAPY